MSQNVCNYVHPWYESVDMGGDMNFIHSYSYSYVFISSTLLYLVVTWIFIFFIIFNNLAKNKELELWPWLKAELWTEWSVILLEFL